ncbi:MAG: DUF1566 domain-containing protein, partial [Muribaculaceae bacterium]|nr:DUF1566 domain-containing protein [Muribaculaceae bacterium]
TGQHGNDGAEGDGPFDYMMTDIAKGRYNEDWDGQCHGYVLALTDVENDLNNLFEWELDNSYVPYLEENIRQRMDVNIDSKDWGGYYNTLKILNTCRDNGWYKNWYPAAYAAYYYGNLVSGTVEVGEKGKKNILFNNRDEDTPSGGKADDDIHNLYKWQEPLQAPENTSGWFLPGNGMLIELKQYNYLFEQRFEEIKMKLDDKVPYKEYIGWLKYHDQWRGYPYYWSSTESGGYDGRALSHEYSTQNYTYPSNKSKAFAVRAVLAY